MEDFYKEIAKYFKPSTPISDPKLFVGRRKEQMVLYKSLVGEGKCPIIYGVRGVGKTSLLDITADYFCKNNDYRIIKHVCSSNDSFKNIFNTFLRNSSSNNKIASITTKKSDELSGGVNLPILKTELNTSSVEEKTFNLLTDTELTPSLMSEIFKEERLLLVIDEFDRISKAKDRELIADTAKTFSDMHCSTKIVLSGVANSMVDLIDKHYSTIRNFISIKVPRMIENEIIAIIENGVVNLNLKFTKAVLNDIVWLSDGLPYFTHLISECLADYAYINNKRILESDDLFEVLNDIVDRMFLKEIVEYNYLRAIGETGISRKRIDQELNLLDDNYSKFTKQVVLSLLSRIDYNGSRSANEIIFNEYEFEKKRSKFLDELELIDIEIILSILSRKSEIIYSVGSSYFFKDSFHKIYTRIKHVELMK